MHDFLYVFVGTGDLVDNAFVLSSLDAGGLRFRSSIEYFAFALVRDIFRPALCEHELNDSGFPRPLMMNDLLTSSPE